MKKGKQMKLGESYSRRIQEATARLAAKPIGERKPEIIEIVGAIFEESDAMSLYIVEKAKKQTQMAG